MKPKTHPVITLEGVGKTYVTASQARVTALSDINLSIFPGDFVTIIGPTGCGKTSLLNLITGMTPCTVGILKVADDLKFGKTIGCVSQNYKLFPWLTVLDNVSFGLKMRRVPKKNRHDKARRLLNKVGLSDFEHAYPRELPGGMRQRVAIAQALAIDPKLLLMDEPFGALDDRTRMDIQNLLVNIWRQDHLTILFVTHNIDEAALLGQRVLVFSDRPGRIIADEQIRLERPRNRISDAFADVVINLRRHMYNTLNTDV